MKLKHETVSVPEQNPFQFDMLDRKQQAEMLTTFIKSIDEPLTMSVEAGWGHGKTTFFRMWAQHLKNNNFSCISFNAWESDYSEDPFIPFVAELRKSIIEAESGSGEISKKLADLSNFLRKTGIQVAKRTLPVAVKMITAGLLDADDLIKEAAGDAIEKAIEQKFDEYEADRESVDKFKLALAKVVQELKDQEKQLPLVFMIDELDRCRPTYALALLERIKHIFNVDGIIFVLAIDRKQLLESIRTVYGSNTDATRYLRRFIDFGYTLPDPKPEKYPSHLMSTMNFHNQFSRVTGDANSGNSFLNTFTALSTCFGMRLRDQEHAFSLLSVVWRVLQDREDIDPFILAALLVLKVADEDMYEKLIKKEIQVQEVFSRILKHPAGIKFMDESSGFAFEASMRKATEANSAINAILDDLRGLANQVNPHPNAQQKLRVMENMFQYGSGSRGFNKVVASLEVTNQFKN